MPLPAPVYGPGVVIICLYFLIAGSAHDHQLCAGHKRELPVPNAQNSPSFLSEPWLRLGTLLLVS